MVLSDILRNRKLSFGQAGAGPADELKLKPGTITLIAGHARRDGNGADAVFLDSGITPINEIACSQRSLLMKCFVNTSAA